MHGMATLFFIHFTYYNILLFTPVCRAYSCCYCLQFPVEAPHVLECLFIIHEEIFYAYLLELK